MADEEVKVLPELNGRKMTPAGKGFLLPPRLDQTQSLVDAKLRRKLVGAFEPGVGFAIVNQGQLCYTAEGQAHIYVMPRMARSVLEALGNPPGYEVVSVLTADRSRCTQTMI